MTDPQRGMVGIGDRDLVAGTRAGSPSGRADMIAPVLADAAVASTGRLLRRRYDGRLAASRRWQLLVSAARELPRSDRTP